jgi:endonuclease YncB( thermonuclease family)
MLKINVSITDHEGALQVLENAIANTNSVVVELSEWNAPAGVLLGDAIVDGQRLSELLINSGYANPIS